MKLLNFHNIKIPKLRLVGSKGPSRNRTRGPNKFTLTIRSMGTTKTKINLLYDGVCTVIRNTGLGSAVSLSLEPKNIRQKATKRGTSNAS